MNINNHNLTFEEDRILVDKKNVMMLWEHPIMEEVANYICRDGGDILEMGFGMGISADYIQSHNIDSHTIVECHPQILEKLYKWAKDKPNVTILAGRWWDVRRYFKKYNGIFHDTYGRDELGKISSILPLIGKDNMKFSYFGNNEKKIIISDLEKEFSVKHKKINVNPSYNDYYNHKIYYMPEVEFYGR